MSTKYKVISESIENDIKSGKYRETGKLPTEDELIRQYRVSRNTIRKAVDILVKRGIIMPIQGSGMFLRKAPTDGCVNLEVFHGLTAGFSDRKVEAQVVDFKLLEADAQLAEVMECAVGTPVYHVQRLRLVDGKRFVVEYSYFNKDVIPYLSVEIARGSIYRYITEDLKKQIGYVDRVIEAGRLSKHDAELLGLEEGDPALISINRAMLKSGVIFDYSIDIHNYKHTKFLKLSNFV
ncbi:MAG: GntR family transcriptional regulator [Firmicutes bacterium]|nr:GntR family transcriptional regulator [Bacillota bacterium]HOB34617.1 GntR family transcriptional regulator [Bacillota bacterium]HPZ90726.1 GntR family transcriptional regulator [Bacillota bacterium]HQE02597.1 GntR family transcriptional regulator [Bacillota bacterium]